MSVRTPTRRRLVLIFEVMQSWEPLFWIAVALLTVMIVAVRFDIGQNADGLLQTLMSLDHLTVFFWEQNRFANLVPLLTSSITDPTANAQAQLAIRVITGIAAPLLCVAPLAGNGNLLLVGRMTLLATSLALAFAPHRFLWEWFIEASPYGTSFALGGCALLLLNAAQRGDGLPATALRLGGLLLTIAAYMVNISLVLFTAPLFGLLTVTRGSRLAIEFGFASIIGGMTTVTVANWIDAPHTALKFGETFVGLTHYLGLLTQKPGYFFAAMLAAFVASVGITRMTKRPGDGILLGYGLIMLTTFAVAFVAIALNSWVITNSLHPRYLVPLYILAASLGAISIVTALDCTVAVGNRSWVCLGLCLATLLLASERSLPPVPHDADIVDRNIRAVAAAVADDVFHFKLDGIAGDYWIVWPAIFLAEQRAHDLGQAPGHIFGASYRGKVCRNALQDRLFAQGHLDFACLDLLEEPCGALVSDVIGLPLSGHQSLLQYHLIRAGHRLSILRLTIVSDQNSKIEE